MRNNSEKGGLITVGERDSRVTKVGYFLRKSKLDELPQLFNILKGEMSFVGPRPEVRKYVDLYSGEQLNVLNVKPGLTDYASIEFVDENKLLDKAIDPEKVYVEEIMPQKINLALKYIREKGIVTDAKIMVLTVVRIIRSLL